jgi:hypothetical protein
MFAKAWGNESLRGHLQDPDAIAIELVRASFMHGKPWASVGWLLEQKPGEVPNLLKLMQGTYRGETAKPKRTEPSHGL